MDMNGHEGRSTGRPGGKTALTIGFVPLTDCAPLVAAHEKGYFARHGLEVTLVKEQSWASIRDKLAYGVFDAAQMLATMPLACTLGVDPVRQPMVTALNLDLNGNAITVSAALYARMLMADPGAMAERPISARALRAVIEQDRAAGRDPLTFAMVFPVSTHNYELRYWLAAGGVDPDRDVRLAVVPPPQMVGQLRAGNIDGYCVGEPWNALAVREGLGRTLLTSYEIWNNGPEKVLGVNREWVERNPATHRALLMALLETARWLDRPDNREEAVRLLARPDYLDVAPEVVRMSMTGTFQFARDEDPRVLPDFNVFHRYAANYPWRSQAVWFITQMLRWGHIDTPIDIRAAVDSVYRPDLYREAAEALGLPTPLEDSKPEGIHAGPWMLGEASGPIEMGADRFLDGRRFDAGRPLDYLAGFAIAHPRVDGAALAAANGVREPAPGALEEEGR